MSCRKSGCPFFAQPIAFGIRVSSRGIRVLAYDVVAIKDCVGSRNREAHDMALKLMEQSFFDIATAADIGAIWR